MAGATGGKNLEARRDSEARVVAAGLAVLARTGRPPTRRAIAEAAGLAMTTVCCRWDRLLAEGRLPWADVGRGGRERRPPTEAEVAARAAEVRESWTPEVEARRRAWALPTPAVVPGAERSGHRYDHVEARAVGEGTIAPIARGRERA